MIEAAIALFATPGNGSPVDATLKSSQLRLVKSSVIRRLSDPSLSVEKIAQQNAMSVRNLHWLFEENDETAWRFVVSERLKRCQKDLCNPAMCARSVTDIAFAWGFSDAAYFSRVFKEKFGTSPSQFRNAKA
ncbi:MAG: helix-turn-helix domain-containing protein [Pseudomonadota bacterium]